MMPSLRGSRCSHTMMASAAGDLADSANDSTSMRFYLPGMKVPSCAASR